MRIFNDVFISIFKPESKWSNAALISVDILRCFCYVHCSITYWLHNAHAIPFDQCFIDSKQEMWQTVFGVCVCYIVFGAPSPISIQMKISAIYLVLRIVGLSALLCVQGFCIFLWNIIRNLIGAKHSSIKSNTIVSYQ